VDTGFPKRSCSNKKIERDDDSKKSHPALDRIENTFALDGDRIKKEPRGLRGFLLRCEYAPDPLATAREYFTCRSVGHDSER
jgi:hypothetical protein